MSINVYQVAEHRLVALQIKKSLGLKRAAGYLRNRGYSVEAAVWILLRR